MLNNNRDPNHGLVPLCDLQTGQLGVIASIHLSEDVLWKFMEMGFGVGCHVRLVRRAPLGDPLEVELLGYRLAVRAKDVRKILVRPIPKEKAS
jgi:ferrous iron transport protein A